MPVTLKFSADDSLGSQAIRLYERGIYSHVDIVLTDGSLLGARDDVRLGIPAGVQIRPSSYLNGATIKQVELAADDIDTEIFLKFVHEQIGKPYDQTAILAFVFNRDWREQDSWFCSELAATALEHSGVLPFKLASTENKVTPGDLFLACSVLTNVWNG